MTTRLHPVFGTPLPQSWQVLPVDEVKSPEPSSCVAGPFGSNISSKYFVEQGIPVIRGKNLRDDLTPFVAEGFVFVSEERAKHYRAQHVRAGDLVFTCWGTIGQVGRIPEDSPFPEYIISNKQLKLRANAALADSRFLFYYFASPQMVAYVRNRAIGSAVPGINLGILKALPVALPSLSTQRRIASILSAYDDLIENNTRRIQILEAMAQAIYREWFVEFRFPGHEGVRMVDSALGPIPEGWSVIGIGEVVQTLGGGTPSKAVPAYWEDGVFTWYTPTDLTKSGSMFIERSAARISLLGLSRSSATAFPARAVMMTSRATIGVVSITTVEAATNQGFITCVANERLGEYHLYFWLLANVGLFSALASGATFKEISRSKFRPIPIAVPPPDLERRFHEAIAPIGDLILNLQRQTSNLRSTRDLLLPRLISGEIDVSDLDLGDAEPAA